MRVVPVLLVATLWAVPARASAADYEVFIDVDSEEELVDLLDSDQISGETFDVLSELLRHGLDLDQATRAQLDGLPNLTRAEVEAILAYRARAGTIGDPRRLVYAGVLPADKLGALLPFLRRAPAAPARGWLRAPVVYTPPERGAPPAALSGALELRSGWSFGVAAVLTRQQLGPVGYDPGRDALVAAPRAPRLRVPKLHVSYARGGFAAIAGSYRIGFGQRLTFDSTSRFAPDGFVADDQLQRGTSMTLACREAAGELAASPCEGAAGHAHTAPDFRWREGLLGAAVSLRTGPLAVHAFASSTSRPVYQYELYDRRVCSDPAADDDPACAAPIVYRRAGDPEAATSRFTYSMLPDVFRETTLGGNLTWRPAERAQLGATAYLSSIRWRPEGLLLDFQEFARYPRGGGFAAVGVDGAFQLAATDVAAELTRSFDHTPGGGGDVGAILRTTTSLGAHELESVWRYYGADFANPYARPIAQADERDGLRARDETGLRLRYAGHAAPASLRASADVWLPPSEPARLRSALYLHGDLGLGAWRLGGSVAYLTRDARLRVALHLTLQPIASVRLSAQLGHTVLDDAVTGTRRHDGSAFVVATWAPDPRLRLRTRARYADAGLFDDTYLESTFTTSAELAYQWSAGAVRARFERRAYLDARASTALRTPNPEHWLLVEVEARF